MSSWQARVDLSNLKTVNSVLLGNSEIQDIETYLYFMCISIFVEGQLLGGIRYMDLFTNYSLVQNSQVLHACQINFQLK